MILKIQMHSIKRSVFVTESIRIVQFFMKCMLFLLLLGGSSSILLAQMVHQESLAPGVMYTKYTLEGPHVLDVIEVDLSDGNNKLLAWRSGGLIPSSIQASDASHGGRSVLSGINADFFSFQSTLTIGNQVTDGEWVMGVSSRRSHVLFDKHGEVHFGRISFHGELVGEGSPSAFGKITGVNRHRSNDQVMFYNAHYGLNKSRSDTSGIEFVLRLLDGQVWSGGDTLRFVVDTIANGDAVLSQDVSILSVGAGSTHYSAYADIQIQDTLSIFLGFSDVNYPGVMQVVGGGGAILRNGENVAHENVEIERIAEAFLTTRHPRSLVAKSKSGDTVWLITVDGRQTASIGMNFDDMASFLKDLGAWDAVNLDGGGSTAMVVNGKVVNIPSDPTGERAVANVLLVERVE
jgi:hypothetical protein